MDDPKQTQFNLVMQFLDGSPTFCKGFDCGRWWEILKRNDVREHLIFATVASEEQLLMICSKLGWTVEGIDKVDDYWRNIRVTLRESPLPAQS